MQQHRIVSCAAMLMSVCVSATGCPRGKYSLAGTTDCLDCDKGYYCAGGDYVATQNSSKIACPPGMTTIGKRTETARGCGEFPAPLDLMDLPCMGYRRLPVPALLSAFALAHLYVVSPFMSPKNPVFCLPVNTPGYSYSINATGYPSQTACPMNTYSPGFKKQRACVPCPTGFITTADKQVNPSQCCEFPLLPFSSSRHSSAH
jgi:hypothetical protein